MWRLSCKMASGYKPFKEVQDQLETGAAARLWPLPPRTGLPMTTVTQSRPADTYNLNDWYSYGPVLTLLTSSHFQISDGIHTLDYYGRFLFNSTGLSGGVMTEMSWSENGAPVFSLSDMSLSVQQLNYYTQTNNPDAIGAIALRGKDTFIGSYSSDEFYGYTGNDTFNGEGGRDTVVYEGTKNSISISANETSYLVSTLGKVDTLNSIERISMSDGSELALDVRAGENAGSAYRLYQAAFDRKPDTTGLNYWTKDLDAGNSIQQVAKSFVDSAEFKALNPSSDQNALINNFYLHVLHRDADATGLQYWKGEMNKGMTASEVLVSFSESQENINNVAPKLGGGVWLI